MGQVRFIVMDELMDTADALYKEVQEHRSRGTAAKAAEKKEGKRRKLQETDPW